jgi:diguanylate cyclase (GGDEF)-like protein
MPESSGNAGDSTSISDSAHTGDGGRFSSIGLPAEAGWYVSAALYWVGGLSVLLIDQFSPSVVVNSTIAFLALLVLAISPLMLLGAHFAPNASWGAPVRIAIPSMVFVVGGWVIGDAIGALVLLLLFPLLAIAYLHKASIAIANTVASVGVMTAILLVHDSSDASITRALVLVGVTLALSAGLIFSQSRVRRAAAASHSRSMTDPLTGLANLRALHSRLAAELQRASRDRSEIVMFGIDLDDFKEVNDRYSYALGDAVLQAVANALSVELEPEDLLVRRGGDEFAVLTLASPGRHVARFGDRLAAAIERARRAICPEVNPHASITRVNHRPGESAEEFLRRVDDGLHDAKIGAHPERSSTPIEAVDLDSFATPPPNSAAARVQAPVQIGTHVSPARRAEIALDWRLTAAMSFVPALLVIIVAAAGIAPGVETVPIALCVLGLIGCAAGSLLASRWAPSINWLHIPIALTLLLIVSIIALSGSSRESLVELCALPAPLAVVMFGWRRAMPYALVSGVAYGYFLIESQHNLAVMQTVLFLGIMTVLIALLERGQHLTSEFTEAAEAISAVDPLTGAANLRGYEGRVDVEIARCEALGGVFCLAMIDLERFKAVNDRYSHSMGDKLLIDTARAIGSVVRGDELVVRRGGDEFAVVSGRADAVEMETFARRVSEAIFAARIRLTPDIAAGATVVNVFWEPGESAGDFMRRADEELRLAKARERGDLSRV